MGDPGTARAEFPFLTTGEVAGAYGVSIPTVKRWIRDGRLRAIKTSGGHFHISRREFLRFRAAYAGAAVGEGPPRILVVDDEPTVRAALVEALGLEQGSKVEAAVDGYEGLVKVGTFRPHLLVLDLLMPGLDGFRVCQRVKADPVARATKILAITACRDEDVGRRILQAGADGFLLKPFQLSELRAEVARLLGYLAPFPVAGEIGWQSGEPVRRSRK